MKERLLECDRCKHVWGYKGQSKYFATCSYCRRLVSIKENLVDSEMLINNES